MASHAARTRLRDLIGAQSTATPENLQLLLAIRTFWVVHAGGWLWWGACTAPSFGKRERLWGTPSTPWRSKHWILVRACSKSACPPTCHCV